MQNGMKESVNVVQTEIRALSDRADLYSIVTALLPLIVHEDFPTHADSRELLSGALSGLNLDASDERTMAMLPGAVETALWVVTTAGLADVDAVSLWQDYASRHALTD